MRFEEALKAMREGKKVKRRKWGKYKYWRLDLQNNELMHKDTPYTQESSFLNTKISVEQITADDWEVVDD